MTFKETTEFRLRDVMLCLINLRYANESEDFDYSGISHGTLVARNAIKTGSVYLVLLRKSINSFILKEVISNFNNYVPASF